MSIAKTVTYTTGNVADLCGVSITLAQQWIKTNELRAILLPGSNHPRIYPQDLITFMKKHGFMIPKEVSEAITEPTK